uniref:RelA/SpoT domain-containing protein n=1 Tax=Micromonas pusilla TaxID=38833 RepID=A0A7S0KK73_MICPS|mmetsp:Transcript_15120/g.59140  ORF Transcript_15120/g.59140 Transcript_15120/m.59140 type:complete len:850 (+) Transcript_15120:184-2733(+)
MMLGTSPAHEALIHGSVSSSRGVPAAKQSASPAAHSTHVDVRSASPGARSAGFGVLSSSPSETGNGNSMITPGSSFGGRAGQGGRRRSGDGVALAPSPSPTVTGFALPSSSSAENSSVGTRTRMTPLGTRSFHSDFPEETVVGFDAGFPQDGATESVSASPPMSPGGLSRSISALRGELSSATGVKGSLAEPTVAVPVVTTAQRPTMTVRHRAGLSPEKPPVHRPPGRSGLLSGRLEELTADEEATLLAAQARHGAFSSPAVVSAFRVAAAAHRGQLRKNGDSVLSAQVGVALIVAELGMDSKVVAAALLHDVLDDTPVTERELRNTTPDSIVTMVTGVSKLSLVSQLQRSSGRSLAREERLKLRALLVAMTDARVVIVKLADRLQCLETIHALGEDTATRIAEETLSIYVPLASRLGIWSLKTRLEDACFAYLHPEAHDALSAELARDEQKAAVQRAVEDITSTIVADAGISDGIHDIYGRAKSLFSVHRKMLRKGVALGDVHDLRAVRVIVDSEDDCYAALEAIHGKFAPVPGKTKDYVRNAKMNGYQSLHTVVVAADGAPVEVQIRTAEMHRAAESGMAAHWRYKESVVNHGAIDEQVAWARFMLSWQGQLVDDKCRAAGVRIATAMGAGGGSVELEALQPCVPCECPFPAHCVDCPNHEDAILFGACGACAGESSVSSLVSADSASMSGRVSSSGASSPLEVSAPIFVVVVVDGEMAVVELPKGSRLSDVDFASVCGDEPGAVRTAEFTAVESVTVNRETVPPGAEPAVTLRMGDLVEVRRRALGGSPEGSPSTGSKLSHAAAAAIEEQRRRLSSALKMDVSSLDGGVGNVVPRPAVHQPEGFFP